MYTPATSSEETLHFPLTLRMKLMALAPQFYVSDKNNRPIAYIKQKLFKLKQAAGEFVVIVVALFQWPPRSTAPCRSPACAG